MWVIHVMTGRITLKKMETEEKQGKSEGFDSCDQLNNLAQILSKSSIFQPVWPWHLMDDLENNRAHLPYYIKLCASFQIHRWIQTEVTVRKHSIRAKLPIFCPLWPSNLMDDLGKQQVTSSILHQALCIISKPWVNSSWSYSPEMLNLGQNRQFFVPCDLEIGQMTLKNNRAPLLCCFKLCAHFIAISEFKLE